MSKSKFKPKKNPRANCLISYIDTIGKFSQHIGKRHPSPPSCRWRLRFNVLDVSGEDSNLEPGRAGSQQDIVWMPVQSSYGWLDGFFDMLSHPPVVLLFEIAHRYQPGPGSHGKLVLFRAPFDTSGCSVDSKKVKIKSLRLESANLWTVFNDILRSGFSRLHLKKVNKWQSYQTKV